MAGWVTARTTRVALFATEPRLARSVHAIVGMDPELVWVSAGDQVDEVLELCESRSLDVLLIHSDSDPGGKFCLMLTSFHPELTVVVLLADGARNPVAASWALLHGARGLVGVDAAADRLGVAIKGAVDSGHHVDSDLEVSVMSTSRQTHRSQLAGKPLSAREFEVLQLIATGLTAEQIGNRLGITTDTVRTHIGHLLRKLQARDRAHAVAISFETSLLPARFTSG